MALLDDKQATRVTVRKEQGIALGAGLLGLALAALAVLLPTSRLRPQPSGSASNPVSAEGDRE